MADLSELEQTKLKDLFDHLDEDGDGLITPDDLKALCAEAGGELDDETAEVNLLDLVIAPAWKTGRRKTMMW